MDQLKDIVSGFFSFKKELLESHGEKSIYNLYKKQEPQTLIISCSDSRVDPAILLNANLGEIFVIRNVANIIPPFQKDHSTYHGTSAALEFAIKILNIENIIVIGHSSCGGIKALLEHNETEDSQFEHILDWVMILKDAKQKGLDNHMSEKDIARECEQAAIKLSIENLKSFPFIQVKKEKNKLKIYGLYLELSTMDLYYYHKKCGQFKILEQGNSIIEEEDEF